MTARGCAVAVAGGAPGDLLQFLRARVVDHQLEEEAVELRFGQRVGALQVDRVLRRQHEERLGQRVRLAAHRDGVLLHRFQHGRLGARRGAVDLVGQDQVGEDRPGLEGEAPALVALGDHVGADDVGGHQVGRELDAAVAQVHAARPACAPAASCPGPARLPAAHGRPASSAVITPRTTLRCPTMIPASSSSRAATCRCTSAPMAMLLTIVYFLLTAGPGSVAAWPMSNRPYKATNFHSASGPGRFETGPYKYTLLIIGAEVALDQVPSDSPAGGWSRPGR